MTIKQKINEYTQKKIVSVPKFFDLKNADDVKKVEELIESRAVVSVSDDYEEQMKEYFQVQNPALVYAPYFKEGGKHKWV